MNTQTNGRENSEPKPTPAKRVMNLWLEGLRVLGRVLWFAIILKVMLLPLELGSWLMDTKLIPMIHDDSIWWYHMLGKALALLYLPFACLMASRVSKLLGDARKKS